MKPSAWIAVTSLILAVLLVACGGASQGGDSAPLGTTEGGGTAEEYTLTPPPDFPVTWPASDELPRHPDLPSPYGELYMMWQDDPAKAEDYIFTRGLQVEGDRVRVRINLDDVSFVESVTNEITSLNGEVVIAYENMLSAWIPILNLPQAASLPGVSHLSQPAEVVPSDGFITPITLTPSPTLDTD